MLLRLLLQTLLLLQFAILQTRFMTDRTLDVVAVVGFRVQFAAATLCSAREEIVNCSRDDYYYNKSAPEPAVDPLPVVGCLDRFLLDPSI